MLNLGLDITFDNVITCRTGKEYRRNLVKLIVQKLIQEMVRLPIEFSAGVVLVLL